MIIEIKPNGPISGPWKNSILIDEPKCSHNFLVFRKLADCRNFIESCSKCDWVNTDKLVAEKRCELLAEIKAMKYEKPKPTIFEIVYNLAIDNILKKFEKL